MDKPATVIRPSAHDAWDRLSNLVATHSLECVCARVLEDPDFCEAPGSAGMHHCRHSGLLEHTAEVVELALDGVRSLTRHMPAGADDTVVLVAGIYHDLMKIRDYFWEVKPDGRIAVGHKPYHKMVHHVSGSYAEFMRVAFPLTPGQLGLRQMKHKKHWMDAVGHAILAHHGRLEWHSPVEPSTREALILHQADTLSASTDASIRTSERWQKEDRASN